MSTLEEMFKLTSKINELSYRAPAYDGKKIREIIKELEDLIAINLAEHDKEKQLELA